jgi:hypothetical protein
MICRARRGRLAGNAALTPAAHKTAVVRPAGGDLDRLDVVQAMQWQVVRTFDVTDNRFGELADVDVDDVTA